MKNIELLKGTLGLILLRILSEGQKMYGYEIMTQVKEITNGKLVIGESALYPALHKLEIEGLLKSEEVFIGKRKRKYYYLTVKGNEQTKNRLAEFEDYLQIFLPLIRLNPKMT